MDKQTIVDLANYTEANNVKFEFQDRMVLTAYLSKLFPENQTIISKFITPSIEGTSATIPGLIKDCKEDTWKKKATASEFYKILLSSDLIYPITKTTIRPEKPINGTEKKSLSLEEIRQKSRAFITKELEKPLDCLTIEDEKGSIPIGTLGNISMITGIAKSKKTFLISSITAALLSNKTVLKFTGKLPKDSRILYIDTEQGPAQTRKVFTRILKQAGISTETEPENIEFLSLRPYSNQQRLAIIEHAVYNSHENLRVLIIDGARDLVMNLNDPEQATIASNAMLKWSDEKNIHIVIVIHQNKGDKNPRGHLGSEMTNKAETVISIEAINNSDVSMISGLFTRDKNFEPFAIHINDNGYPELTNDIPARTNSITDLEPQTLYNLFVSVFEKEFEPLSYNDLCRKIKLTAPVKWKVSDKTSREIVSHAEQKGMITNEAEKGKKAKELILSKTWKDE